MDTKALRQKVLDLAIRGKLVPQNPNDEPASVLLERIRQQKQQMVKEGKLKAKNDLPTVAPVRAKTMSPDLSKYVSGSDGLANGTVSQFTIPFCMSVIRKNL